MFLHGCAVTHALGYIVWLLCLSLWVLIAAQTALVEKQRKLVNKVRLGHSLCQFFVCFVLHEFTLSVVANVQLLLNKVKSMFFSSAFSSQQVGGGNVQNVLF